MTTSFSFNILVNFDEIIKKLQAMISTAYAFTAAADRFAGPDAVQSKSLPAIMITLFKYSLIYDLHV